MSTQLVTRGTSPYTSGGAGALVPEEVSYDFLQTIQADSMAMQMFQVINMGVQQERIPVLNALPQAYFISGDTGAAKTTSVDWKNKYISTAQLGVVVPIPRTLIADSAIDMFTFVKPLVTGALSRLFDQAVFLDEALAGAPTDWPTAIGKAAYNFGSKVARGTAAAGSGGLAEDINQAMGKVRTSGFRPNIHVCDTTYETFLTSVRDTLGQPIMQFMEAPVETDAYSTVRIYGRPGYMGMEGLWPSTGTHDVEFITGDKRQAVIGLRQDMEWRILDQATIPGPDGSGDINLAMQNMLGLQVIMRVGWQMANIINWRKQGDDTTRYPFAVITNN